MEKEDRKKSKLFDKLNSLNEEICEGIRNLSDSDPTSVNVEISVLRDLSYREISPEVEFATLLFRRYSDIATVIKRRATGNLGFSRFILEEEEEEASPSVSSPKSIVHRKIFWVRFLAAVFAFLSFVVMSATPNIDKVFLHSSMLLEQSCMGIPLPVSGAFDLRPFQAIIAYSVLIFIHSVVLLVYYILPVDESTLRKYVPGVQTVFLLTMSKDSYDDLCIRTSEFLTEKLPSIEMSLDIIYSVMGIVCCLIASILLERGSSFQYNNNGQMYWIFFSMGSFYETYKQQQNCFVGPDATRFVRGSLAMAYVELFFVVLTALASIKAFRKALERIPSAVDSRSSTSAVHSRVPLALAEASSGDASDNPITATADRGKKSDVVEIAL